MHAGEKMSFMGKASFWVFNKIVFPSKRTKKADCNHGLAEHAWFYLAHVK